MVHLPLCVASFLLLLLVLVLVLVVMVVLLLHRQDPAEIVKCVGFEEGRRQIWVLLLLWLRELLLPLFLLPLPIFQSRLLLLLLPLLLRPSTPIIPAVRLVHDALWSFLSDVEIFLVLVA